MKGRSKQLRRPAPIAPKIRPASQVIGGADLLALSLTAQYVGSVQHKDGTTFLGTPAPRTGATHARATDESPDCMLCPRKWAWNQDLATDLLQLAIQRGQFDAKTGVEELPKYVWARDPEDREIVYEARKLSQPVNGYKAYPLTQKQTNALGIDV